MLQSSVAPTAEPGSIVSAVSGDPHYLLMVERMQPVGFLVNF